MTAEPPAVPSTTIPYAVTDQNDYQWTERAFELMTERELSVEVRGQVGGRSVTAQGECPRCTHDVEYRRDGQVLPIGPGDGWLGGDLIGPQPDEYVNVDLMCWCRGEHEGRPKDVERGCGIVFAADVRPKR